MALRESALPNKLPAFPGYIPPPGFPCGVLEEAKSDKRPTIISLADSVNCHLADMEKLLNELDCRLHGPMPADCNDTPGKPQCLHDLMLDSEARAEHLLRSLSRLLDRL